MLSIFINISNRTMNLAVNILLRKGNQSLEGGGQTLMLGNQTRILVLY